MTQLGVFIQLPDEWTDIEARALAEALAVGILPSGLLVRLVLPSVDGEGLSPVMHEWATS